MTEHGDKFVRAFLRQTKKKQSGYKTIEEAKSARNYLALYQTAIRYRSG